MPRSMWPSVLPEITDEAGRKYRQNKSTAQRVKSKFSGRHSGLGPGSRAQKLFNGKRHQESQCAASQKKMREPSEITAGPVIC